MAIDYDAAIAKLDAIIAQGEAESAVRKKALRKLNRTVKGADALLEKCEAEMQALSSGEMVRPLSPRLYSDGVRHLCSQRANTAPGTYRTD